MVGEGTNTNISESGVFHSILQYISKDILLGGIEGLKENLRRDSDLP